MGNPGTWDEPGDDFTFDDTEKSVEELDEEIINEEAPVEEETEEEAPEKEATEEQPPVEAEKAKTEVPRVGKQEAEELKSELIKKLGADAQFKVKGKIYPLKDLPSDEVVKYVQLGLRSDQVFRELRERESRIQYQQNATQRAAEQVNQLRREAQQTQRRAPVPRITLPAELQPNEFDTQETAQLKGVVADLYGKLGFVEANMEAQQLETGEREVVAELEQLQEDFPVMSPEEVVAVKAMHPHIPIEEIAKVSDDFYGSMNFVNKVFKAKPALRREVKEAFVKEYLAERSKLKGVPSRPSSQAAVRPIPKKTVVNRGEVYDFDKAKAAARADLKERERAGEEEESY